jgi:molybdopterin converting factor small subunit
MTEATSTAAKATPITVRVLFFSVLRERVGRGEIDVSIGSGACASQLLDELSRVYPAMDAFRGITRIAVNQIYVDEFVELREGDEVALITPVSGG